MTDREILEKILFRLDSIENDISDIKHVQQDMQSDISNMKQVQQDMQSDISSIKMTLENDIEPKISDLYSQYITNSDRVSAIEM